MATGFKLPDLPPVKSAWGPHETEQFSEDVPYAPFSKGDRLGKIADWSVEQPKDGREQRGRQGAFANRFRDQYQTYGHGAASVFAYQHSEDESSFSVIDRGSVNRVRTSARNGGTLLKVRGRGGQNNQRTGARGGRFGGGAGRGNETVMTRASGGGGARGRRFGWKDYDKHQRVRNASVTVGNEWELLEEVEFSHLSKLNLAASSPETVDTYGYVYPYDKSFDKVHVKSEKPLQALDRVHYNPTTTEDPVIQKLAVSSEANIFITDSILSLLMCSTRSVHPWDIVITRQSGKLFFDKREGGPFDYLTVNENAYDSPMDADDREGVNSPAALSVEATYINQNFSVQAIREVEEEKHSLNNSNPFYNPNEETEPLAAHGYVYRKVDLSLDTDDKPVNLMVRAEVDGYMKTPSNEVQYVSIKALNEYDPKFTNVAGSVDWRSKLESQRGAVFATEMKNNSCKLARWTTEALLAGVDSMKIGFVSRSNIRDAQHHGILGVVAYKPADLANQMNMSLSNGWGIVRTIADVCLKMPDGKYVLVKDPNRPIVRLYSVPPETFEEPTAPASEISSS
ncbi:translation initiation factor eIF3d Moe1 [Schizosaccharomyces cryophilus OY26]|uniref:Eukaryotic translation initiation factor 3 subunit D n=1 Tax=Schizosaccharomyces cryophilus (strain OY26 / ATCC MYA-4695 / CBS 11777 / NBRC 106824 / NRRL Y48691) TaxID=653667 RepID=S9VXP4_SCHCR|nr:translation initiation factor eIF3d Moe1 [Schizosaccharomyces cryophilus OY26]EPY52333.1 translation initiation factor eIF3d Moe1 [Schizosaccharomyces cryophilus OY26]